MGPLLMFQNVMDDGRHLAVAVEATPDGNAEVVTVGTGRTAAEPIADCKNDLIGLGYPAESLTFDKAVYERPDNAREV